MKIEFNCAGGDSALLTYKDRLESVPESHRHLVTPQLAEAFADPIAYFRNVAARCPFPAMQRWLERLLAKPKWKLELGMCNPEYGDWSLVGFTWSAKQIRGATIALPVAKRPRLPPTLDAYYSLVDTVHFSVFGGAGGLHGTRGLPTVAKVVGQKPKGEGVADVTAWGSSGCGDQLVFTRDDRGGWWAHETNEVIGLRPLPDVIDWIFTELLANREPESWNWPK